VHGRGFRFIPDVTTVPPGYPASTTPVRELPEHQAGRPSIAVLPFQPLSMSADLAILSEAIPHEIIQTLSRLRWLAVIARGSSFRFRQSTDDLDLVKTALAARYVLSGIIESRGRTIAVTLELTHVDSREILWADRLAAHLDGIDDLRERIVVRLVSALETHIPFNEARTARLNSYEPLDAWANYHVGLSHLYRFTSVDTALAQACFKRAVARDPQFARAHAGLSFTSFLDAFLRLTSDPATAARDARRHAERSLELDALDPFANFTMGRSFWLTDDPEVAADWLARATALNPNYAQGFYASAFTAMLSGNAPATVAALDTALQLSPLDPLLYGIYGVRAQILIQQEEDQAAANWADRAARTPGAHYLIAMIALAAIGLAGRHDQANRWRREVHRLKPGATAAHYFAAFPTRDATSRARVAKELCRYGF
jgi:TolB-like protein